MQFYTDGLQNLLALQQSILSPLLRQVEEILNSSENWIFLPASRLTTELHTFILTNAVHIENQSSTLLNFSFFDYLLSIVRGTIAGDLLESYGRVKESSTLSPFDSTTLYWVADGLQNCFHFVNVYRGFWSWTCTACNRKTEKQKNDSSNMVNRDVSNCHAWCDNYVNPHHPS